MTSRLPPHLTVVLAIAAILAGCTSAGSSPSGDASGAPSQSPSAAVSAAAPTGTAPASPTVGPTPGASSTTTVDWGVIWDSLPVGFPSYPGSQPTITGGGPASAILDIPVDPPTASTWYQEALAAAGYTIVGANGPRENGGYAIVATRDSAACEVEISLAPLGTTTTATIFLGAACPFT